MKISFLQIKKSGFVLFAVFILVFFIKVATTSGPLAPIKVTVIEAVKGDLLHSLYGIGTVDAQRAYLIGPTAAGRVKQVLVDVGDAVKVGQLLAEMEPVDLDQRLDATKATVSRAHSSADMAKAQLSDARTRQVLTTNEADRYAELGRKRLVSQSIVDAKLQEKKSADAQLISAAASLAIAEKDISRMDAELGGVDEQRENLRLRAPFDGIITSRDVEPGSTVIAGQSVLKMHDPASLWITLRIDQGRSNGLTIDLPVDIQLRSHPRKILSGSVVRVEPESDSVTEERIARVAFNQLPVDISTGEMAEVTLKLPTIHDAVLIPNSSLHYRGDRAGVWLLEDGKQKFTYVNPGAESLDGKIEILDGLQAGNKVIVYSESELTDKSRIVVVAKVVGKSK